MKIIVLLLFLAVSTSTFAEYYVDSVAQVKIPFGNDAQVGAVTTIQAAAGMEFVIILDANATTGYEWQLARPLDESRVRFVSSEYFPDNTGLVGSGGKSVWTFEALRTGKTKIFFKYVRPWEKDIPAVKESEFIVDIRKKTGL
jgi:inhibitor of cysteine peptidase